MSCVIHAMPTWVSPCDTSRLTHNFGFGQSALLTGYTWYIKGTKENIMIDAGCNPEYFSNIGIPAYWLQSPESALNELGLSASDIDIIILTHLHIDHVMFISKYPKAKVLIY